MSKKFVNESHVEGYVYEHKLEKKVSGDNSQNPGTEFITGTLSIATDEALTNVVQVHFTYVTEVFAKSGKPNATYATLLNIIEGKMCSVMEHGKDRANKVRIDSAIALNEWYDRNSGDLISQKRNEGGFIHPVMGELGEEKTRSTFNVDMLITGFARKAADEERNLPEKGIVKGCVFDFRGSLLPVEFSVLNPKAMDYFEDLEPSQKQPVFTRVQGSQVSQTITKEVEEVSAFGDSIIKPVKNTQRDFVIKWAQPEPYEWDSEGTLLASELAEKIAAREVYLAGVKKRQEDYQNSRNSGPSAFATQEPKSQVFSF